MNLHSPSRDGVFIMILGVFLLTRFLHAGGGCVGPTKGDLLFT